uniref:Fibronectin type III domain-containing protein n=1 Tax=Candidatus Kentrum sp. LFY TaxID=2126342 RepID=A0A450UBU3_9GAMM|nr:MAG: Fibronectin type III domain-containing protein [Candidatus Kentron sp. LFY]
MSSRKFPTSEANVLTLGQEMSAGLGDHADVYPAPPVDVAALNAAIAEYEEARDAMVESQARAKQDHDRKDNRLSALVEKIKTNLRYAENTVGFDDGKLKLIGWRGRKAPGHLTPPGQARNLESPDRGDGWIALAWAAPTEGGKVSAYRVERRAPGDDAWTRIDTAMETEARVSNQPQGEKFEFCVVAVNKAGDGARSNVVTAVL